MSGIFDYDHNLPLAIQEAGVEERTGVFVRDLSYLGPSGRRIRAYLVEPRTQGPRAALMFVHPGLGARTDFLAEAIELARAGGVALLPEAPWAQGQEWPALFAEPQVFQQDLIHLLQDLRQGVGLLLAQPGVDAARSAYVGHSFGALFGGILSGVERRIRAFVLMSGVGSFTDVAVVNIPGLRGEALEIRRRMMDPIDPIHHVAQAAPTPILFQFGLHDEFFSHEQFRQFYDGASRPKSVQWYETDHYGINAAGRADRSAWLSQQLGLRPRIEG